VDDAHRFRYSDGAKKAEGDGPMLRCVIFDLDNTLVDSDLDFAAIKAEIGTDEPILEYRATAGDAERRRVDAILERHESRAAETCGLCEGAEEMLRFLRARGIRTALLTRNSRQSVNTVLARLKLQFDFIVSREDSAPKPSPEPIFLICKRFGVQPGESLVVGDYLYDIQAGQAAGARTILVYGPHRHSFVAQPDHEVASLHEARAIMEKFLEEEKP
jgi:HAD superfamily hydrolase (TIGR01549 family)